MKKHNLLYIFIFTKLDENNQFYRIEKLLLNILSRYVKVVSDSSYMVRRRVWLIKRCRYRRNHLESNVSLCTQSGMNHVCIITVTACFQSFDEFSQIFSNRDVLANHANLLTHSLVYKHPFLHYSNFLNQSRVIWLVLFFKEIQSNQKCQIVELKVQNINHHTLFNCGFSLEINIIKNLISLFGIILSYCRIYIIILSNYCYLSNLKLLNTGLQ